MDWFLYDNGLRHERVKNNTAYEMVWNMKDCEKIWATFRCGSGIKSEKTTQFKGKFLDFEIFGRFHLFPEAEE